MKVLIVRAFPNVIDLKKNCYNHQEVGLASAFLELGHEAGIVYYGGSRSWDDVYHTIHGDIHIFYRKAKVLLKEGYFFLGFRVVIKATIHTIPCKSKIKAIPISGFAFK